MAYDTPDANIIYVALSAGVLVGRNAGGGLSLWASESTHSHFCCWAHRFLLIPHPHHALNFNQFENDSVTIR